MSASYISRGVQSTTVNLGLVKVEQNLTDPMVDAARANADILDAAAIIVAVPVSATAAGKPNQIAYDATHIYVCVAVNTWVRATLATF
jgi:hypothetical protein